MRYYVGVVKNIITLRYEYIIIFKNYLVLEQILL